MLKSAAQRPISSRFPSKIRGEEGQGMLGSGSIPVDHMLHRRRRDLCDYRMITIPLNATVLRIYPLDFLRVVFLRIG
jgi:hypothetical protein